MYPDVARNNIPSNSTKLHNSSFLEQQQNDLKILNNYRGNEKEREKQIMDEQVDF